MSAVSETKSICAAPTCQRSSRKACFSGVFLTRQELLMLLKGDASTVFEPNPRPLSRHQDWPRQPFQAHSKTMQPPQEDVGRNRASMNHIEQVFRARFDERHLAKRIECFFRHGTRIAILGGLGPSGFGFEQCIHDPLPVAFGDFGIARRQIRAGEMPIECRLVIRLVLRAE